MTPPKLSDSVLEYREKVLARLAPRLGSGARLLEVGTGMGYDAVEFARRYERIVALDLECRPEAWAALAGDRVSFVAGDAERLPFADGSFDCVFSKDSLHHFAEPERAVAEFWRVARPGATCQFLEANRYNPLGYVHMTLAAGHEHLSRNRFLDLVRGAGAVEVFEPFEAHVWPLGSRVVRSALRKWESAVEKVGLCRPFLSYNYAVVRVSG